MNPASWLSLAEGHEFTQPRAHFIAHLCSNACIMSLITYSNNGASFTHHGGVGLSLAGELSDEIATLLQIQLKVEGSRFSHIPSTSGIVD